METGKKLIKRVGKEAGWQIIARTLASMKGNTPITTLHRRAELMGRLGLLLVRSRRRVMRSNLSSVFPDWSEEGLNRTADEVVRTICHGFVDLFYYAYHPHRLPPIVRLEKNGVLEDIASSGRGCILATGHVGLFPLLGYPMVARGMPFGPIARDFHDERVTEIFDMARSRIGFTSIPDRPPMTTLKRALQVLRKGGGVMIAFDMHPADSPAIEVNFLGRPTPMFSTVVRLAARTGLPLVRGSVLREADGMHYRVTYNPPIDVPPEAANEDSPLTGEILQDLADWLSDTIRNNPEQYWWIHRRWRGPSS